VDPRAGMDVSENIKILIVLELADRTVQPIARRYTDYVIATSFRLLSLHVSDEKHLKSTDLLSLIKYRNL
jgi:hypothetical protein